MKVCKTCSKEFTKQSTKETIKQWNNRKFCSMSCYGISRKNKPTWNSGKTFKDDSRILSNNKHPMWNGGKNIREEYVFILNPEHPFACKDGYIREHRLVVEKSLNRHLTEQEQIHHINENKSDNRISNLYLFPTHSEHMRYHKLLFYKRTKRITKSNL